MLPTISGTWWHSSQRHQCALRYSQLIRMYFMYKRDKNNFVFIKLNGARAPSHSVLCSCCECHIPHIPSENKIIYKLLYLRVCFCVSSIPSLVQLNRGQQDSKGRAEMNAFNPMEMRNNDSKISNWNSEYESVTCRFASDFWHTNYVLLNRFYWWKLLKLFQCVVLWIAFR